jgi:diaminobutyrate-2-oxoglutarate transaminase
MHAGSTLKARLSSSAEAPGSSPERGASASSARLTFSMLWLSETAVDFGTSLVNVAIGVWIFAQTGSARDFSLSIIAATGASMFVTPFAGAFADRYDRRRVVLLCDLAAIALAMVAVVGFTVGRPAPTVLYLYSALAAAIATLRRPAMRVAISAFISRDRLAQASGLLGMSKGAVMIAAPSASGFLMGYLGLPAVLTVQACLLSACALLVFAAFTRAGQAARGGSAAGAQGASRRSPLGGFTGALGYLREVPLMRSLVLYGALVQCLMVLATAMFTPLVLSTHSPEVLGLVMSVGIVGAMCGSMLLVATRVRKHLMMWVLVSDVVQCAAIAVAGWSTSVVLWCPAAFACLFCGNISVACSHALWMRKAPISHQGSVFALLGALNMLVMAVSLFVGGYLADDLLEPALRDGGALVSSVGPWFGTGKGRGIGLLFAVTGAVGLVITVAALANGRLRRLDELVPERADA